MTVLIATITLAAGAIGGYWLPKRFGTIVSLSGITDGSDSGATAASASELWYTCGMHPNVLQRGPGDCPICQMKLTPLKKADDNGDGGAAQGPRERKVLYWRAPMDPNYISDRPGTSPMGMDLVPVYADEDESPSAHTIRIDPVTIQNMGIRTTVVSRGPLVKTIRTVGRVDYDEQLVTFIDTKFNGWIEKLDVNQTGQYVAEGDALFDVYSPELYAAQEEYLAAVRNLPRLLESSFALARQEAAKLVEAARTKLKYMDVSDEQIDLLRETGKVEKTLTIHSPASGIVTEKMALEGMYVKPGMRLFTIADLSHVWVYVDIYEYQLPWIRIGQIATMSLPYVPGREFVGKVVYIYPYLEQRTRVVKVRLEFANPALELKPGMYANIILEAQLKRDALLVPREAYIDSGTRQVAFVDLGNGKFSPRDIQVGVEAEEGMVEVLYGLDEGEVVVTSGQFLLDGESKLKEAVAKMMAAERAKTTKRSPTSGAGMAHATDQGLAAEHAGAPTTTTSPDGSGIPAEAKYACPMDEHPDETDPSKQGPYFSPEAGRCPWCGMAVKALDDLDWVRVRRAAKGGDVAYTCPDHQHVFSAKTGQCPRCGRRLSPFKVVYTCPDREHAGVISTFQDNCPHCGRGLAAFRGVWLDETMAAENVPPDASLADAAPYRCPLHPLVHSDRDGNCTICGASLESAQAAAEEAQEHRIPDHAKYTCPMKQCWHFSAEPSECPVCGMNLKPVDQIKWARELLARAPREPAPAAGDRYVCPMHPDQVRGAQPATCSICGMQLVDRTALKRPKAVAGHVAAQMDYIMEHYLEVQRLLASDRTTELALHALGLASASKELLKHIQEPGTRMPPEAPAAGGIAAGGMVAAAEKLHASSLKITGVLASDRVTFVDLSAAVATLVEHARPDRTRWPKLYVYHCPMSKGDWLQSGEDKANPYYGLKMLKCGELKGIK